MSEKPLVLIIDDEEGTTDFLSVFLEMRGFRATKARNAAETFAALDPLPDLILLDLSIPGEGGLAILERLRSDPRTRPVPVILCSADDSASEEKRRAMRNGAVEYLSKPFALDQLLVVIQKNLKDRSSFPA